MARTLAKRSPKSRTYAPNQRPRKATRRRATARPTKRATPSPRVPPDLQAFFDDFTNALTAGNGDAAAQLFEYPALMVMSDRTRYGPSRPLDDAPTVSGFFANAPQMYNAKGIARTFADVEDVQHLAPDVVLVRARFPYIDADGNDMGDGETSLYVVRKDGSDYAICAAVTLGVDSDRKKSGN